MATKYEAYEGQVTFYASFQTLESMIVAEAIDDAIPEHKDYKPGSQWAAVFSIFRMCLSNTERIEFALRKDADEDLKELKSFWKAAANNADYAALWPLFRKLSNDVSVSWQTAIGESLPARLLAPSDIQPTAADDEVLDPNALTPAAVT